MDLFSEFRRATALSSGRRLENIEFLIAQRSEGYVLMICADGDLVDHFEDIQTTGPDSDLLDEVIRLHQQVSNSWYGEGGELELTQNPGLVEKLRYAQSVKWEDGSPLRFVTDRFRLKFLLEGDMQGCFSGRFHLEGENRNQLIGMKSWDWLADGFVTDGTDIYVHEPVGNYFSKLKLLTSKIPASGLAQFLSIIYSYFRNLDIEFSDYRRQEQSALPSVPTISIDEVDEDQSLIISIFESLPHVEESRVLQNYSLSYWVSVNHMEKVYTVSRIDHCSIVEEFKKIRKKLRSATKSVSKSSIQEMDSVFILNQEAAQVFVTGLLPDLLEEYRIIGSERLKDFRVRQVSPKLRLTLGSGIQFIDGDASLEIEGEEFALYDLLRNKENRSYVVLKDGTKGLINRKYIDRLKRLLQKVDKDGKVQVSFFDLPFVEEFIEDQASRDSWKQSQDFYLNFNKHHETPFEPNVVQATLRDYQVAGIRWLSYLQNHGLGACLADDMGLGKTVQTISVLSTCYKNKKTLAPSLVVMPRSLLFNWANELEKFAPHLTYYTYHGVHRDLKEARKKNLILTTYGSMRSGIEELKEEEFHYIVLDESQNIKNVQSQTSKAAMLLCGKHRIALSGTPIENNLGELYALFRFLNPGMFGTLGDFQSDYLVPVQQYGDDEVATELRRKISPFILRRLKKDVLKDLPPKVEQHLFVEMDEEHSKIYRERQAYFHRLITGSIASEGLGNSQFVIFQALAELRQLASLPESKVELSNISAKREILVEQASEAVANGHKLLIFVNFLSAMDYLCDDLESQGISCLKMSGQTNDRQAVVDKFQHGNKYSVLVMTLKTGGVGLNLTRADMVYIFDPWWNVAAENQAIDRTHRMGQDKTVFCYRLITKGTIEDKILQLQAKKQQLFDQLLSGDEGSVKKLSEEDIHFILSEAQG